MFELIFLMSACDDAMMYTRTDRLCLQMELDHERMSYLLYQMLCGECH